MKEGVCIDRKREIEIKSLNYAKKYISQMQYPDLYDMVNGELVDTNIIRPDFIGKGINKYESALIGIEHFSVSLKGIIKPDGAFTSLSELKNRTWENMYKEVQKEKGWKKLGRAIIATFKHLCNIGTIRFAVPYTLPESFNHSLNKHINNLGPYLTNLNSIRPGAVKKIIFLIDVHLENPKIYVAQPPQYNLVLRKSYDKLIDLSLINILQQYIQQLQQVDWIIFNMYTSESSYSSTVCLDTHSDITKQLEALNYIAYNYIGDDSYEYTQDTPNISFTNLSNYDLNNTTAQSDIFSQSIESIGKEKQREREQLAISKCLEYEQKGFVYACTPLFAANLRKTKRKIRKMKICNKQK